jgi:hypothetical protein
MASIVFLGETLTVMIPPEYRRTPAKLLYDGFLWWCAANHEKPLATNQFAAKLAERGFERKRGRNGVGYIGVELVAVSTTDTPAIKRKHRTEMMDGKDDRASIGPIPRV